MQTERRKSQRMLAGMEAAWGAGRPSHTARLRDLSYDGCFVNSTKSAEVGSPVVVEVSVPGLARVPLPGTVVRTSTTGFAVRFNNYSQTSRMILERIIRYLARSN